MGEQVNKNNGQINQQVLKQKMQNFKYGKEVPEYVSMAKKNFPKHQI